MPYLTGALSKVSLLTCAVVEVAVASLQFILLMLRLSQGDDNYTKGEASSSSSTITVSTTDSVSLLNDSVTDGSTEDAEAECPTQNLARAYYIVISTLLLFFLLLSSLVAVGIKKKSRDLVKSYVEINVTLSVLCLIVYVLTLAEGDIEKEFAALMGFFLILRFVGILLGFSYYFDQYGSPEITFPIKFRASRTTASAQVNVTNRNGIILYT